MKCEKFMCIYQDKGECILDEIEIDITGQCTECIHAEVDDEILREAKIKLLKAFGDIE